MSINDGLSEKDIKNEAFLLARIAQLEEQRTGLEKEISIIERSLAETHAKLAPIREIRDRNQFRYKMIEDLESQIRGVRTGAFDILMHKTTHDSDSD